MIRLRLSKESALRFEDEVCVAQDLADSSFELPQTLNPLIRMIYPTYAIRLYNSTVLGSRVALSRLHSGGRFWPGEFPTSHCEKKSHTLTASIISHIGVTLVCNLPKAELNVTFLFFAVLRPCVLGVGANPHFTSASGFFRRLCASLRIYLEAQLLQPILTKK